jgi:hypothetical protein
MADTECVCNIVSLNVMASIEWYRVSMGYDANEYYWMVWLVLGVAEFMCNVYLLNDNVW